MPILVPSNGSMATAANISMSDGMMVMRVSVSVIAPRCSGWMIGAFVTVRVCSLAGCISVEVVMPQFPPLRYPRELYQLHVWKR